MRNINNNKVKGDKKKPEES